MPLIYTAIFGPYDTLKEPRVITPGWEYICFTDQDFKSDVWKIKKVNLNGENARNKARYLKINFHKITKEHRTIWIDGSFTINCDLNEWWDRCFSDKEPGNASDALMACIKHPVRNSIYDEGQACIDLGRGEPEKIKRQLDYYAGIVPTDATLIQSGILMRINSGVYIQHHCKDWWCEIEKHSSRDQISFGKVFYKKPYINYITWDYRTGMEFIFTRHNTKS